MANAYPSSPGASFAIEPFAIGRAVASTPAAGEKAAVRSLAVLVVISFAMWASVLLMLLG